jgi:hypothetical protein
MLLRRDIDMLHRHAELRLAMLRSDSMLQSEMLFDVRDTMLLRFRVLSSRKELLQGEMPHGMSLRLLTKYKMSAEWAFHGRRRVETLSCRSQAVAEQTIMTASEKQSLHHPWLVAVWPGMGHVALNAGYFLLAKLQMHLIAEFTPRELLYVDLL